MFFLYILSISANLYLFSIWLNKFESKYVATNLKKNHCFPYLSIRVLKIKQKNILSIIHCFELIK